MTFTPRVCDVSKYEWITDPNGFELAKNAGIWGIISKATQGTTIKDPYYLIRRKNAKKAGLLFGSYHFNGSADPKRQVDHYLTVADPQPDELTTLDYEDYPQDNMNIHQAVEFLHLIEDKTGQKAVIYSGNKLKQDISKLNTTDRAYVASHRLWLAQYSSSYSLPHGFDKYWLWQYTGDGVGPTPHWVDGIKAPGNKGLDLNVCHETSFDLFKSTWAKAVPPVVVPVAPVVVAPVVPSVVVEPPHETAVEWAFRRLKEAL